MKLLSAKNKGSECLEKMTETKDLFGSTLIFFK